MLPVDIRELFLQLQHFSMVFFGYPVDEELDVGSSQTHRFFD